MEVGSLQRFSESNQQRESPRSLGLAYMIIGCLIGLVGGYFVPMLGGVGLVVFIVGLVMVLLNTRMSQRN